MQEVLVAFTVPGLTPPTVNHYKNPTIRHTREGYPYRSFAITAETKAFRQAVAIFSQGRSVSPETAADLRRVKYHVRVDVYLGKRQRMDADNAGKTALDSLQWAGIIHSDAYVSNCELNIHKEDRANPRTEFLVESYL